MVIIPSRLDIFRNQNTEYPKIKKISSFTHTRNSRTRKNLPRAKFLSDMAAIYAFNPYVVETQLIKDATIDITKRMKLKFSWYI